MDVLTISYLVGFPLLLLILLFIKAKPIPKGEWNDDFLGLKQTKAIQGFCALCIVFHHMSQKTAAPWLPKEYIIHGLDVFIDMGCMFVGVFLFFSGYGLYKSYKSKENYLDNRFIGSHYWPILLALLTSGLTFWLVGRVTSPYTWYIYAILYLYLAFYVCFKFCKNDKLAIFFVGVAVVLYAVVCDRLFLGGWWFNTVGLFPIGILLAKNEQKFTEALKKGYVIRLLASIATAVGMWYASKLLDNAAYRAADMLSYQVFRIGVVAAQFISCVGFVGIVLLAGMKIKFGNKILSFLGSMTLELYLIHGVFVQLFGYSFVYDNKHFFYIKNIPLYVVVVLACGILAAFLLNLLHRTVADMLGEYSDMRNFLITFGKRLVKIAIGLVVIIILSTVYLAIDSHNTEADRRADVQKFSDENITYAEVDGKKMAAFISGEGEKTVVYMRGMYDPCPTMSAQYMAERLSKHCKVVVLDYFGSGFSDDADTERSVENITYEIHTALHDLGIKKGYILMPQYISGLYAQYYVNQYPDEVVGVIGLDTEVTSVWESSLKRQRISPMAYKWSCEVKGRRYDRALRIAYKLGYHKVLWPLVQGIYSTGFYDKDMTAPETVFFSRYYSANAADELRHEYDSYMLVKDMKYPENISVVDMLSIETSRAYEKVGVNWAGMHSDVCATPEQYSARYVVDMIYCQVANPVPICDAVDKLELPEAQTK